MRNKITKIKPLNDRRNYILLSRRNDGTEKEFIADTGSPITILPQDKEITKGKNILSVTRKYQYVTKTEVKSTRNITVEAESKILEKKYPWSLPNEKYQAPTRYGLATKNLIGRYGLSETRIDYSERDERTAQFEKLIKTKQTIKVTEFEIHLNCGRLPLIQKARLIPYRL